MFQTLNRAKWWERNSPFIFTQWPQVQVQIFEKTSDYWRLSFPWICTIKPVSISQALIQHVFFPIQWVIELQWVPICTLFSWYWWLVSTVLWVSCWAPWQTCRLAGIRVSPVVTEHCKVNQFLEIDLNSAAQNHLHHTGQCAGFLFPFHLKYRCWRQYCWRTALCNFQLESMLFLSSPTTYI